MELGVVGLPNVGKSTLFNAITKGGAMSANYPFCTIEPNVGVVDVPDERLNKLAALYDGSKREALENDFATLGELLRQAGIVAAAHSGWKGTVADMMGSVVRRMEDMGARAENIRAAIGPAISRCCFETGPEVPEAVRALLGSDAGGLCLPEEGVEGKFLVDLKETNRRRLLQLGLALEHIDVSPDCTMCMQDVYWSHRATKGRRGTMASVIML